MIHLLNCDRFGATSIKALIDAKLVQHHECITSSQFEVSMDYLTSRKGAGNTVIFDTISRLSDTIRISLNLRDTDKGTIDMGRTLMAKKESGGSFGNDYSAAGNLLLRNLLNIAACGYKLIVVAHERMISDMATLETKVGPDVNPALFKSLMACASDCWRLRVLHKQSGEYPPGTRVLQLTEDAETAAKTSVPMSLEGVFPTVPQYFVSPTLPKIRAGVGADPTWLFLYGSPGSGKTTFSCSDVIQEKK